jgi:erythromycin esterase
VGDEVSTTAPATATVPCVPGPELDGLALVRSVQPAWAR